MNEYQKQFELFCKIAVRLCVAIWVLGLLQFIPDPIADKIVNKFLSFLGLG